MFQPGDIICFLGDSITADGRWEAEVFQSLVKRVDVQCYNCGASGSRADIVIDYLQEFCFSKKPTHVSIAFGVNDIDRWACSAEYKSTHADSERVVENAIENYKAYMEKIIRACQEKGAQPILCTPIPYDEYSESEEENLRCDYALEKCANIVKTLAEKYACQVVDFRKYLLPIIPNNGFICPDRVHPTDKGCRAIAQIYLQEIGAINRADFNTPFVFEEWNKQRYDVEIKVKMLDFIERVVLWPQRKTLGWGVKEMIAETRNRVAQDPDKKEYMTGCYEIYLEHANNRDYLENELIKLTLVIRNRKNYK